MAMKFDINDPKTQRMIAAVIVPIVILYAFFHLMIKPKMNDLDAKTVEVVDIEKKVTDIEKTLELPEKLNKEKEVLQAKYEEMEELLPSEENVAVLLNQFSTIENDSKVYIIGFEAAETVVDEGKPYRANNYRVTIESGFHQFSRFMSYVLTLPRIMSISDLNISLTDREEAISEGLEDQPRFLKIEFTLTTYVFSGLNVINEGS